MAGLFYPDPNDWKYTLTPDEMDMILEHVRAIKGYNDHEGYPDTWPIGGESDFEIKFRGYAAEYVASKLTGLPWRKTMFGSGFKERKACDIGQRTEVRNAKKTNGRLGGFNPKKHDDPRYVYLLVTGLPPTFWVRGWLEGTELAEMPMDYSVPSPARFARIDQLHEMPLPEDA
jgi:hypothetical protein